MHRFMMAWPSPLESFSVFHKCSRKRLTRPSSRPSARPFRQLVERVRPVVPVDEVEIRIARMVGNRTPMLRIFHAVDDGPVTARGFAEAAAMVARGERAEFVVEVRDQLASQVVRVVANGRRIDVLVAAE